MNLLLIAVLLLFAGNIYWGYKKGFLRVGYSLVAWIICLAVVSWATPYVTNIVVNTTDIPATLQQEITVKLQEAVADADVDIQLPEIIATKVLGVEAENGANVAIDKVLEQTGAYAETALKLAMLVIDAGCFIGVLIVTKIALAVVEKILGFIHKLPLIGSADKALGIAAGAIKALIITWLIMAVAGLLASTENGSVVVAMIYESKPLLWLYENNVILKMILSFL